MQFSVTITPGPVAQLAFLSQPANAAAGAAMSLTVEVRDQHGNVVMTDPNTSVTETITIAFTPGTNTEGATLSGLLTAPVSWPTGRATFSGVSVNRIGSYSLTAADNGMPSNLTDANSNAFSITHGALDKLSCVAAPTGANNPAATAFSVVIEAQDAFGNPVTTDPSTTATETVTLAFTAGTNSEGATLAGTLTQNVVWPTGRATFAGVSVNLKGDYGLTGSDSGMPTNLADATCAVFSIVTGAPTLLTIITQPPGSVQSAAAVALVVEVQDAGGNVVITDPNPSANETITVAFTSGTNTEGATISGTLTQSVNWTTGRASFSDLAVNFTGNYSLTASDGSMPTNLPDVTSGAFSVVAGPPKQLAVVSQPPTTQTGTAFTMVVEVRDSVGNVVLQDPNTGVTESISITFTAGTNNEGAVLSGTLAQTVNWATGRATFSNLSVNLIGNYSISAADVNMPSNLTDAATNAFNITAGPPSQMTITTQPPASSQAASAFTVVVEVRDVSGNPVTVDPNANTTEAVTLAFATGTNTEGATLGGTLTKNVDWSTGRASFTDVAVDKVGNYGLTASDANMPSNLNDVSTASFSITVGPLTQLAFAAQPPSSVGIGAGITVIVAVRDAGGNTVTIDPNGALTETVSIGFTSGTNTEGATLSGVLTQNVNWTTGQATFSNLSVNVAGSYGFTATDANMPSNLTDAASTAFGIFGSPSQLVFTTHPASSVAQNTTFTVVVEVRDANGTPITSDPNGATTETITVGFTSGTNTEGATLFGTIGQSVNWSTGRITLTNLSVNTAGEYSLTATDANMPSNLSDATSTAFTVTGPQFLLTVSADANGTGTGTVTSAPSGISCTITGTSTGATDCTEPYNQNTVVTLSQSASAGSKFGDWSGSCSGTASCQVTLSSAQTVTPRFLKTLADGVADGPFSGGSLSERAYHIVVPVGAANLSVKINGSPSNTGDADVYVRQAGIPTTSLYDCRPFIGGNDETCSFVSPAAGDWYVMVRGFSAYTGVNVVASTSNWASASSGVTTLVAEVWCASSTDCFAVGDAGVILRWNGSSWSSMFSGTSANLRSVWGTSSSNVYAVGSGGLILRFNGSSWTPQTSGVSSSIKLLKVWGISSTDIFASGESGTIVRSNGSTWSSMSSGTTADLWGLWGTAASNVIATGTAGVIRRYDGSNWNAMSSGTSDKLSAVFGFSASSIYAVGGTGTILSFNGSSWSSMNSGTIEILNGVWGTSSTNLWAVGAGGVIRRYDGSSWSGENSTTSVELSGIFGTSGSFIIAVGQNGVILRR